MEIQLADSSDNENENAVPEDKFYFLSIKQCVQDRHSKIVFHSAAENRLQKNNCFKMFGKLSDTNLDPKNFFPGIFHPKPIQVASKTF